jgi:hypothetical protein
LKISMWTSSKGLISVSLPFPMLSWCKSVRKETSRCRICNGIKPQEWLEMHAWVPSASTTFNLWSMTSLSTTWSFGESQFQIVSTST